ncbi:hypothetical protein HDU97_007044 [Phlyctochytrium planicorne]|nr:hypothetical protein HDU97_007044 [Phlyctochytrium planicorne]
MTTPAATLTTKGDRHSVLEQVSFNIESPDVPPSEHQHHHNSHHIHIHGEHEQAQLTVRSMKEFQSFVATRNQTTIELAWKDLTVTTRKGEKVLLNSLNGAVKGRLLAIMGPSGSGKTTMMNTLAYRQKNAVTSGSTTINGADYTSSELKSISGYVMQDDLLNAYLTVEETLMYTAELRLPSTVTAEQRKKKVDEVIKTLGINHCRHTIIGNDLKRGISGGERKRVCVAQELLTDPVLLFLDEPTSGLDSITALSLCKTLKKLTEERGCTVITTIHQPQSKIFGLFDDILLLNSGTIVYYGEVSEIYGFFSDAGFPCPPHTNFADHMLDVIIGEAGDVKTDGDAAPAVNVAAAAKDNEVLRAPSEASRILEEKFLIRQRSRPQSDSLPRSNNARNKDLVMHRKPSWYRQFNVLLRRCFKEQFRGIGVILTLLAQSILMGVLIGTAFLQIGNTQSSIVRRQPVLFFCVINQGIFGALTMINSFPSERLLVLRERAAGTYRVSAYFLAKNLSESVVQLFSPIAFSIIVYPLIGLQMQADKFFIFAGFMILCATAANSVALLVSAICRTTTLSITVLPMVLELARLFGGFFLSPANLPKYFSFLDAISYVKYSYVGIALNELTGLELTCTQQQLVNGVCPITSGQQTVASLGLNSFSMGGCAAFLVGYIVVCRFIAYVGVRFIKW